MNRRVLINLVVFMGVFALMLYWAVNNILIVDRIERPYSISAQFTQAAGVKANAEVTYLGVQYGRVAGVERIDGGVEMELKIDRDKHIPKGSIARIFRKSAIGEPYIDFVPPADFDADDTPFIPKGGKVPKEDTTTPLEFSELLRSANAVISSVEPESAGSLIHELSLALDGRGQDLRDLTTSFDTLTATFADRTEQLDRLAVNSTKVTRVLAQHRLSLGQSLTNLKEVASALRDADGDLQVLLRDGPGFLRATADLVADEKQELDCILSDLTPLLQRAPNHLGSLETLLELGPTGFGYVYNTIDREPDGPWVRVNLLVEVGGTPAKVYDPRPTMPVVPTISPCASTMVPASVTASGSGAGGTEAARTASAAAGAGHTTSSPSSSGDGGDGPLASTGGRVLSGAALLALAGALGLLALRRPRSQPTP
jgi:phospholipid/cholesterol/gamma-HCH transport system substrate-binding protein